MPQICALNRHRFVSWEQLVTGTNNLIYPSQGFGCRIITKHWADPSFALARDDIKRDVTGSVSAPSGVATIRHYALLLESSTKSVMVISLTPEFLSALSTQ